MNVLLTDHLSCPRCGPEFGLILLARDVAERRVRSGEFGCPNCRDRFGVTDGFADLRAPPRGALVPHRGDPPGGAPDAMMVAACLAVPEGPGFFVFAGAALGSAVAVARLVKDIEVVAVDPTGTLDPQTGVSPIAAAPGLPFRGGCRGVALSQDVWSDWGGEATRILVAGARVVITGCSTDDQPPPSPPGLKPVLADRGFVVFQKDG